MTYEVELPDGNIVEVPDDVPLAQAKQRIFKAFPQFAPKQPVVAEFQAPEGMAAPTEPTSFSKLLKAPTAGQLLEQPGPAPAPAYADPMLRPEFVDSIKSRLDAMKPEQRSVALQQMLQRPDVYGRAAKVIAGKYEELNAVPEKYRSMADARREVQAAKFASQGASPETAEAAAIGQALAGKIVPTLKQATPTPESVLETKEEFGFKPDMRPYEEALTTVTRGAAKAWTSIAQAGGGVNRFIGDMLGLDTTDTEKTLKQINAFTENMGHAPNKPLEIVEGAISSIGQQLPALVGGALTGSELLVLGSMFLNSFGQAYDEGRRKGLDATDGTARAAMYAAFEVLGEKFGLKETLQGVKAAAKGVSTPELARYFGKALAKEVPGEELTYAGQFAVDKGYGMKPEAGFADFIQGAADTLAATLVQGGMMLGGGAGISAASRALAERGGVRREPYVRETGGEKLAQRMAERAFGKPGEAYVPPPAQAPTAPAAPVEEAPAAKPPVAEAPPTEPPVPPGVLRPEDFAGYAPKPEVKEEAPAEEPVAPGNQPKSGESFDDTGWVEQENKINEKTGKPILSEGRVRYKRTDDSGFVQTVLVQNGKILASSSVSPNIELTNSVLDFDAPVKGFVNVTNSDVQGLVLDFVPYGLSGAAAIKMSPRAVQQYREGMPIQKIAELEFSDAGGIMPDGSRTPHTTVGTLVSTKPEEKVTPPAPPKVEVVAPPVEAPKAVEAPKVEAPKVEAPEEVEEAPPAVKPTNREAIDEQLARLNARDFDLPKPVSGTGKEGIAIAKQQNEARDAAYDAAVKEFLEGPLDVKKPVKKEAGVNVERVTDISPQPIKKTVSVAKTPEAVMKTLFNSAGDRDIRYYLNGIKLERENGNAIATDGHRLVVLSGQSFEGWPAPPVQKIAGDQIIGRDGNYIDGTFPKWSQVVPEKHETKPDRFGTTALGDYARGVEKAWSYTGSKMPAPLRLEIGGKTMAFQASYIADMVDTFQRLGYNTFDASFSKDKLYVTSPDGKVRQVVMPLRDVGNTFKAINNAPGKPAAVPSKADEVIKQIDEEKIKAKGNQQWLDALNRLASDVETKFLTPLQAKRAIKSLEIRFEEVEEEAPKPKKEVVQKQPEAVEEEAPTSEITKVTGGGNVIGVLPNGETRLYREQDGIAPNDMVSWKYSPGKPATVGRVERVQDSFVKKGTYAAQIRDQQGGIHLVDTKQLTKIGAAPEIIDVVNGEKPSPTLPAENRLILMPCSDMKGTEKTRAADLYKGVFFQTLNKQSKEGAVPNVVILSAKHGFVNEDEELEPYNQKMTAERADEMLADLKKQMSGVKWPSDIKDVLIVGGKEYQRVMQAAVKQLMDEGKISKDASVNNTSGGIGDQRSQLGEYLRSVPAGEAKEKAAPVQPYTPEQRAEAQTHADETGGEVVWQKGDYALVRGYSMLSGDPVYVATMGSNRARVDIESFTGKQISDDVKKEMIEVKKRLEQEAERKHNEKPFITFNKGVSVSKGISPEIEGIIRGWKDLLKLGVNIHVSTIEDAKADRNNFTGPHRRIGSGTLDANERGSMRRMADGSYYILFTKSTSTTRMLEVIAHEMGHLHQKLVYDNASPEEKAALQEAHAKWVDKQKGKTAQELVEDLRAYQTGRTTTLSGKADELPSYWRSFGEWYADQTARWAMSSKVPVGIVEKFFKRLGNQLRRFYQSLKAAKYLPDETFAQYIEKATSEPVVVGNAITDAQQDVAEKMSTQENLFGFDDEEVAKVVAANNPEVAKGLQKANELPGAKKKLPPGRSPELAAAAAQVAKGTMTAAEFDSLVNKYKPIPVYTEPMVPATTEQVIDALSVDKRDSVNPEIAAGTEVGLRLDIPAFNRKGIFVVSIHEKRLPYKVGKSLGYSNAASITNVSFAIGNQKEALKIASGASKDVLQTMEGTYVPMTAEQIYSKAKDVFNNPAWIQVGIDPTRHAYFFDRRTTVPVVKADEVLQIGNMILARGVTYGDKSNFLYNIDTTRPYTALALARKDKETRREVIREYAKLRQGKERLMQQVKEGKADLTLQRKLTVLDREAKTLKAAIDMSRERKDSPGAFLARALKEYDSGNISADVLAVIQAAYAKQPSLLNGLLLSVKEGKQEGVAGTFDAIKRIIALYKGTTGVESPGTIRHELTHALEQMMDADQRKTVVTAWADSLSKAIEKYDDQKYQNYFNKVLDFIDNPSDKTYRAAIAALPSYDMYQYISPSEYWAVNGEPLMAATLGTRWEQFKKAIRKLFEGLKNIFGFDNNYAIHKTFDQIMNGSKERVSYDSLQDMVKSSEMPWTTLENIEDEEDLVKKYNRANTPLSTNVRDLKEIFVDTIKFGKDVFKEAVNFPVRTAAAMFTGLDRGLMNIRNNAVFFGKALEVADFQRYAGEVRTADDIATASLALDNALRSGNIAARVIFMGGLEYDPNHLTYTAVQTDKGMFGVYKAESALKEKLGDQLGTNIIQGYLEAKRSRSIENEFLSRQAEFEESNGRVDELQEQVKNLRASFEQAPDSQKSTIEKSLRRASAELKQERALNDQLESELKAIEIARSKINMSEDEIDDFIAMEEKHPELREIMDNWTAVNKNLLRVRRDVGLMSQAQYDVLSKIKDYVPWQRVMEEEEVVKAPSQVTTRTFTNIPLLKKFKKGKPQVITTFEAEDGQQEFHIQQSSVVKAEINGKKVDPDLIEATPEGNIKINADIKKGDLVVFKTNREIENIIDNMTRSVMRNTMESIRHYAASRIVSEYATRNSNGNVMTFPSKDKDRYEFKSQGRSVFIEIKDPLIAQALLGLDNVDLAVWKPLALVANFVRRSITIMPDFQLKQVIMDAPTAALVTGVKNPTTFVLAVYKDFLKAVANQSETAKILKASGIGGYYTPSRTPELEVKRELGVMNRSTYNYVLKALDHVGDASDVAQRIATYERVLKETGDAALAAYQAQNVINFLRHGSGKVSQAVVKTVSFINAWVQQADVLVSALAGGGLKGKRRAEVLARLAATGTQLAAWVLLYCFLVGDDEKYKEMDDKTRLRNIIIPGTDYAIPMSTSAAFFYKALPELIYNRYINSATKDDFDNKRLRTALKDAATDMLLGPPPIPSGVRPFVEIKLDHSFLTGKQLTPKNIKERDAFEQYTASTSEAGKFLSRLTGTEETRLLSPIEADHLMRGLLGSIGVMTQWASNKIGEAYGVRPSPTEKETPFLGTFQTPEVPRGREELFYDLKEEVMKKWNTLQALKKEDRDEEADKYSDKNEQLLDLHKYVTKKSEQLQKVNAEIRSLSLGIDTGLTPEERRKEIDNLKKEKIEVLDDIYEMRKEAGF